MVKKQSIASFIEKLPMDGSVGDCESTLLMTNMDFMGSGTNGKGCKNASADGCKTNDINCINYRDACKKATNNSGCMNSDRLPGLEENISNCLQTCD